MHVAERGGVNDDEVAEVSHGHGHWWRLGTGREYLPEVPDLGGVFAHVQEGVGDREMRHHDASVEQVARIEANMDTPGRDEERVVHLTQGEGIHHQVGEQRPIDAADVHFPLNALVHESFDVGSDLLASPGGLRCRRDAEHQQAA